jgi:hypothetical protein
MNNKTTISEFSIEVSQEIMKYMEELTMHSGKDANESFPQKEKYITPYKKEKGKVKGKVKGKETINYVRERLEATVVFSEKT